MLESLGGQRGPDRALGSAARVKRRYLGFGVPSVIDQFEPFEFVDQVLEGRPHFTVERSVPVKPGATRPPTCLGQENPTQVRARAGKAA